MFANKIHEEAHEALKRGEIDRAIDLYTQAMEKTPNDPNLISDRGVAYLHKNDRVNCFKDLNLSLSLQPNYAYRYASRAFAHSHFKDIDAAINDYEKAVELDPDDAVAHNNLGVLLEQKGYKKQADERFARADKLSKMEDHLLEIMDEMEQNNEPAPEPLPSPIEIDPTMQREKNVETFKAMRKIFSSKKEFTDFLHFIKNGFKIK